MAQNGLAYKYDALEQSYNAQPIPLPRPKLRTIEGRGRGVQAQSLQKPRLNTLAIMSAIVLVVLASVSITRVSIANATVQMMQTAEQTNLAIDQARSDGLGLEVEHSLINNPTRIQDRAAMLGVLPANQPTTLEARTDFSAETKEQMQLAAAESKEAALTLLQTTKKQVAVVKPVQDDGEASADDEVYPEDEFYPEDEVDPVYMVYEDDAQAAQSESEEE